MTTTNDNEIHSTSSETTTEKPVIKLPGKGVTYNDTAEELCRIFNEQPVEKRLYNRGGITHIIESDRMTGAQKLSVLMPYRAKSEFERVGTLVKMYKRRVGNETKLYTHPDVCSDNVAKGIMESASFKEGLPYIDIVTNAPAITRRENGDCKIVEGYDEHSAILAFGQNVEIVGLEEGKALLHEMLEDFHFQTESDKSRALANIITPGLVFGGILQGRVPIALIEADQSQAGKGFLNKLNTTIYNEKASIVNQRNGGVGSLEESFHSALLRGNPFISLDNIRGKIDSPAIESFVTESRHIARVPNSPGVEIDPRRYILLATSNDIAMPKDLANRVNLVRIQKRPSEYSFKAFREGNILDRVTAQQPKCLGAVYAVISEWCRHGCPRTSENRHNLREWSTSLDWIVQNILGCAPLMDGHQEALLCLSNDQFKWLRDLCLAINSYEAFDMDLTVKEISEVCADENVMLPGSRGCSYAELDDKGKHQVFSQLGRKIKSFFQSPFKAGDTITFGDISIMIGIKKMKFSSGKTASVTTYTFIKQPCEAA